MSKWYSHIDNIHRSSGAPSLLILDLSLLLPISKCSSQVFPFSHSPLTIPCLPSQVLLSRAPLIRFTWFRYLATSSSLIHLWHLLSHALQAWHAGHKHVYYTRRQKWCYRKLPTSSGPCELSCLDHPALYYVINLPSYKSFGKGWWIWSIIKRWKPQGASFKLANLARVADFLEGV